MNLRTPFATRLVLLMPLPLVDITACDCRFASWAGGYGVPVSTAFGRIEKWPVLSSNALK